MYFVCRLKKMNTIKQLTTDLAVATKKKADADAAIAAAEKQKADEEKRRADVVLFEFPGANGHVARCRIPTAATIHYGVFRLLLGSDVSTSDVITDIVPKLCGITDSSNYDPATFTGNVFCDWNRGDLNYRHGGSSDLVWSDSNGSKGAWGSYGKGSEWPAYNTSFTASYDPFGDGAAFGSTSVTVDTSAG